ncbi:electron transport complex, RnfABCDGE type, G subunit [Alkaliphilus metalliredigens QYMF]|uniref:Ion-translocating oxidoreductase complex subunit G n=1 Tax=Alkaliphilus metalliredigens (strain QYMF) TaxID=293826 RepID=A6TQH1_ALKMQ|nr:RnfABCDGE type electron transport complex subunit G [Alkaliphilus metalliredigens]ABR48439.1 electron transport complex, RnfABCDGE type, G subunit [Alkaliphilus metalliredigens QYMF]
MREIIKLALILLLITSIAAFVLGITNDVTKVIIQERAIEEMMESIQALLPETEEVEMVEDESVLTRDNINLVYRATAGGNVVGYAIQTTPQGYDGSVEVLVGIAAEGQVTGVVIGAHTETPGLGTKIQEPNFLEQFEGQGTEGEVQVDGISGATASSNAVVRGVNSAATVFEEELKN